MIISDLAYHPQIPTKTVRGIYLSSNPSYSKLIVVDKENGGKADALNTGINISANPCVIKSGRLIKVNAPDHWLARTQVLEYLRAFILGRMAWAKMDGLLIISGAFGMFDREEESTFKKYNTFRDLRKLAFIALLEPFIFHPFTVYAAFLGNWEKLRGSKGWGDMTRTGFDKPK